MTAPAGFSCVMVELTRPADGNAYGAGDVVSQSTSTTTPLEIPLAVRQKGGSGYIVGARVTTQKKSITPRLRIHLYNAATPEVAGDNVNMKRIWTDEAKYLGYIDLPAMSSQADVTTSDTDSFAQDMTLRHPIVAAAGTRSIWAVIETLDAFTPSSQQHFYLRLWLDLN